MTVKVNHVVANAAAGMLQAYWPELNGSNLEQVIERGLQKEQDRQTILTMPYLTRIQVADVLKVSIMTVQRMLQDGRLPHARKIGKHAVRIPAADVEALLGGTGAAK